ncbi:MAG: 50S ribosomal protein L3 [Chlamydiales bacterium]|nr:50S ribosomal protein L3 [Chlamydiales bacterium]
MLKLMGRKRGMTKLFNEEGHMVPCTVIEIEPNVVTQVKTQENDGYSALQLAFEKVKANSERAMNSRVTKPKQGHFKKAEVQPRRHLAESRINDVEGYEVGQEIGLDIFDEVTHLDVVGTSKGKGFQGVIKLFNFSGGRASHGSKFHRGPGSTGMRSTPGRCLPGGKRPHHMGAERVTVQNLEVFLVDKEKNIIVVKGAVPGPIDGLVYLTPAIKKAVKSKK